MNSLELIREAPDAPPVFRPRGQGIGLAALGSLLDRDLFAAIARRVRMTRGAPPAVF